MYEVKLDDGYFYYPDDEKYVIYRPELNLQLNDAGYFECDIPTSNPRYNDIVVRKSIVTVYKNGEMIFRGEVRESEIDLYGQKHIYAIGELAFLNDSIQPQARYQTTPLSMFTSLINQHNSQVEQAKRFTRGMVTVDDPNDYIYRYTNYEPTLTVMLNDLCEKLNGYLRIRYVSGVRYLDLIRINDYGDVSSQEIRLGKNILDYVSTTDGNEIATAVVPLGAIQDNPVVDGLDAYLTIESVNSGKNYLVNNSAVEQFGYCKVVKRWDDVKVASILKTKAQQWLNSAQYAELSYRINAVDLSNIDVSVDELKLGERVRVVCDAFGIDNVVPIRALSLTLNDVSQDKITLGSEAPLPITSRIASQNYELNEEIPSESSILMAAKENAREILEGGTDGGYISYAFNANEQMTEMRIMDSPLEESALKKWVWNMGGLGFLSRKNPSSSWSSLALALTMDGAIVADRITTGTLDASKITVKNLNAGSITTGTLSASKTSGGTLDASKITVSNLNANSITGGTINGNKVTVTNLNASNITSGTMSASRITSGTMSADRISGGTINGNNVSVTNIKAGNITSGTMSADRISGGTINGNNVSVTNINASNITSGALSASRISGGTLTLGGQSNQNGVLNVKDSSNTVIGIWNNDGIYSKGIYNFPTLGPRMGYLHLKGGIINGGVENSESGLIGWNWVMDGLPALKIKSKRISLEAGVLGINNVLDTGSYYPTVSGTFNYVSNIQNVGGGISWSTRQMTVINGWVTGY